MDKGSRSISNFVLCAAVFIIYLAILLAFFNWSHKFLVISPSPDPGLVICGGDCSDFNRYSDYILETGKFYPRDNDYHSSIFYRGFTLLVAVIKGLFGNYWDIAYVLLNGCLTFFLVLFVSKALPRGNNYRATFLTSMMFFSFNFHLLAFSQWLLTDYLFAILGPGLTFILLAIGAGRGKRSYLISGVLVSAFMMFIRPGGVFLIALSFGILLSSLFSERLRLLLAFAAPLLVGLVVFILSASVTAYVIENFDKLSSMPISVQDNLLQLLKFNYLGEDGLTPDSRLGAIIVNSPYKEWALNDGTWAGIMGSFLKRVPRVFEIAMPNYSVRHNAYRYAYYGIIYFLFLAYSVNAVRVWAREPEHLLMVSLTLGYLFILVAMSHITSRFRLPFDVVMALCSAFVVGRVLSALVWSNFMGALRPIRFLER